MAVINGDSTPNTLHGTLDPDTINGLGSDDQLYGFDAGDLLDGGVGDDFLYGGSGDDSLVGGAGEDFLYGQSGTDTASYLAATVGFNLNAVSPSSSTGDAAGDMFFSIERFVLGNFGDSFSGSASGEAVEGRGGSDTLSGAEGPDTLDGGAADDVLHGGTDGDSLVGGVGNDIADYTGSVIIAGVSGVFINLTAPAGNKADAFGDIYSGIELIRGSALDDTILLSTAIKSAEGMAGNDLLRGNTGDDRLDGGDGNDTLRGGAGGDVFIGGAGLDTVDYVSAVLVPGVSGVVVDIVTPSASQGDAVGDKFTSIERIWGGALADTIILNKLIASASGMAGNDLLAGNIADDQLLGVAGDDTLAGGGGADLLDGGAGIDMALFKSVAHVDMVASQNNKGEAIGDKFAAIEVLRFDGANSVYVGGKSAFTVIGTNSNQTFYAGTGAETFDQQGPGQVTVDYLYAADTVSFSQSGAGIVGSSAATGDVILRASRLHLSNFEDFVTLGSLSGQLQVIHGRGGNDELTVKSTTAMTINGGNGDDKFSLNLTSTSPSKISGDLGNDTIGGSFVFDSIAGGDGLDNIDVKFGPGNAFDHGTVAGDNGNDRLKVEIGGENIVEIYGGTGSDTVEALAVYDEFFLSTAQIDGGEGDDFLFADAVTFAEIGGGDGSDVITSNASTNALFGGGGDDTISGTIYAEAIQGAVVLDGGDGDDILTLHVSQFVSGFNNTIRSNGGIGDDHIQGVPNEFGDEPRDEIIIFTGPWGVDVVVYFDDGRDKLSFDTASIGLDEFSDLSVTGNSSETRVQFGLNEIILQGFDVAKFDASDVTGLA